MASVRAIARSRAQRSKRHRLLAPRAELQLRAKHYSQSTVRGRTTPLASRPLLLGTIGPARVAPRTSQVAPTRHTTACPPFPLSLSITFKLSHPIFALSRLGPSCLAAHDSRGASPRADRDGRFNVARPLGSQTVAINIQSWPAQTMRCLGSSPRAGWASIGLLYWEGETPCAMPNFCSTASGAYRPAGESLTR